MKKLLPLLLILLMFCLPASAERVINRIADPTAADPIPADAQVLEVVYPSVNGSDACILRMGDEVWMVDGSTNFQANLAVLPVLRAMGIKKIDLAFNTHPHDDHICGFATIVKEFPITKLTVAFPLDYNYHLRHTSRLLKETGTEIADVFDGDVLRLGDATMTVIRREGRGFTTNDLSACTMLQYGDCTLLMLADIENRAQQALIDQPPTFGLKADILKFPHHGHARMRTPLFRAIDPEISIVTASRWDSKHATKFLTQMKAESLSTRPDPIRLRTDGKVWVIDKFVLPEGQPAKLK